MKAANILKVVDIHPSELSKPFTKWLSEEMEPTYRDAKMKEHLYNPDDFQEEIDVPLELIGEAIGIKKLCRIHEAGYFRIIY